MALKHFITTVAPAALVNAVRARRVRLAAVASPTPEPAPAVEPAIEDSRAASWDEACSRVDGGYYTSGLTPFRIARARLHVPDGSLLLANVLGLAARLVGKPDMAVTDFGGSTGEIGADFLLAWPGARYCVVENPHLAARMQGEAIRKGVTFATEMPERCDIFYCSGALQYLAEPLEIWAQGLKSARHCAILRRNHFATDEQFDIQTSRLFHNGHGAVPRGFADFTLAYPRRTLIESQIHALARHHGFSCIANLDEPEDAEPGRYSRQLIFWRDPMPAPEKPSRAARLTQLLRRLRR